MVLILNDEEVLEGLVGGIGSVLGVLYYKNTFKNSENVIILSIIGWMIVWFLRKLIMRLYRKFKKINKNHFDKKKYGLEVKNFLNMNELIFHGSIITTILVIFYFIFIHNTSIDDTFKSLDKYSTYHILPVIIIVILTFFK